MKAKRKALIGKFAPAFTSRLQRSLLRKSPEQRRAKGERMGRLIWRLGKRRRMRCEANLHMAFPEKSETEIQKIAKETFEHFGRTTVDFLVGLNRTKEELESDMEIIGLDNLQNALAEGKGVLLITGHLGHWERCSAWLSLSGFDLAVVARNANQDDVNNLINGLREGPGTEVIARGDAESRFGIRLGRVPPCEVQRHRAGQGGGDCRHPSRPERRRNLFAVLWTPCRYRFGAGRSP